MRIDNMMVSVMYADFARAFSRDDAEIVASRLQTNLDVHAVSVEQVHKNKHIVALTVKSKPKYIFIVS